MFTKRISVIYVGNKNVKAYFIHCTAALQAPNKILAKFKLNQIDDKT